MLFDLPEYTQSQYEGVYTPPNSPFVCIEPYNSVEKALHGMAQKMRSKYELRHFARFIYDSNFLVDDKWKLTFTFREVAMIVSNSLDPKHYMPIYEMILDTYFPKKIPHDLQMMVNEFKKTLLQIVPCLVDIEFIPQ